ncbi:tRNA pseudouridine synthase A [Ruania halotolerans]|uniref:tRNA pseudouridine synthase A n=1 Tax=Ruania halotolerans TaxID=2897773 RepID=UPI001E2FE50C|nr:tRNA pseudouridine synthase A [Ruania halotolerans]UFU05719.1 tRNA pseudouridine synthase A [Ruania halotolerans]
MPDHTRAGAAVSPQQLQHSDSPTVRVRLDLSYDGTAFSGWAKQPGRRTVEGELAAGVARVLRLPVVALTVAGRTDAGVHARGQVAHVDIPEPAWAATPGRSDRPPGVALVRRLGAVLPGDIVVSRAEPAAEGFDARFSALWRRYAYRIADEPGRRDPLTRAWVTWHRRPLDVRAMDLGAQLVLGEHDFAAYCRPRAGATTIRTLQEFGWSRGEDGLAVAHVRADAFCHSMVRALVGASLAVGEGRRDVSWPAQVLRGGVREPAVGVAPARGLVLEEVRYPDDAALATRARMARSVRTLGPS